MSVTEIEQATIVDDFVKTIRLDITNNTIGGFDSSFCSQSRKERPCNERHQSLFCVRGLAFSVEKIKALFKPLWVRVRWGLRARLVLGLVTLTAVHKPAWISVQTEISIKEMEGHCVHNAG